MLSPNLPINFKYSPSLSNTVNPGYVLIFPAITTEVPNANIARKENILGIVVKLFSSTPDFPTDKKLRGC